MFQQLTARRLGSARLASSWLAGFGRPRGGRGGGTAVSGAAHGWLESVGLPVPHTRPVATSETRRPLATALGEEAFARAWAEGQAMTLEQAVEYALGDEPQSGD